MDINWVAEILGFLAGISILVSFLFKKNVILNKSLLIGGSFVFVICGALILSLSVMFISAGILVLEICTLVLYLVNESEENKEIDRRKKPSINGEFSAVQDLINRKQIK